MGTRHLFELVWFGMVLSGTYTPFALAVDIASVSSLADEWMEALNDKAIENIANEPITRPLMHTLSNTNGGQGLGFQVLGVVIDRNRLIRFGSALTGSLFTIVPIVLGMRQDLNDEFGAANSTSCATEELNRMSGLDLISMGASKLPANATCTISTGDVCCEF